VSALEVELTGQGYLRVTAALAARCFPGGALVASLRGPEMWLIPLYGPGAGGLLLKRRNAQGDRSVLVTEVIPPEVAPGVYPAFWDEREAALRVALSRS
jgi:hydrogenase maturation protease